MRIVIHVDLDPDKWAEDYGLDPHDPEALTADVQGYFETAIQNHLGDLGHGARATPAPTNGQMIPAARLKVGDQIATADGDATVRDIAIGSRTVMLQLRVNETWREVHVTRTSLLHVYEDTERTI